MVFEYVAGGELFDFIVRQGRLSENDARKFMRQIVSAIEYCHSLLIVHRDLKPENLLLDEDGNIKISDFGLSNIIVPGKRFSTFCGSLHYASPEILSGEKYVGPGIDIWSLGIILYCLVVGRQPWDGRTAEEIINAIANQGLSIPTNISDDCVDLIVSMLRVKEDQRIPISDIRNHAWMNKGYEDEPIPCYVMSPVPVDKVDQDIIKKLKKIGFNDNQDEMIEQIMSAEQNQLVATYHLLLEKKKLKKSWSKRKKSFLRDSNDTKKKFA